MDRLRAIVLVLAALTTLLGGPAFASKKPARPATAPPAAADGEANSYADRQPIRYHAEGQGDPALVFIHCWTCNAGFWDAQVRAFRGTHRVVTLDLAGHGGSGKERKAYTMRAFAADVKTVVEALALRKIVVVGHSMGGTVAVEAARLMPEHVVGVVLVDTLQDATQSMTTAQREQFLGPMRSNFKEEQAKLFRQLFPKDADPRVVEHVVSEGAKADPQVGIAAMENLLSYDRKAGLGAVRVPIIAINGDLFPTNADANRKVNPRYEAIVMPGTGHFPHLEKPEDFNRQLAIALGRISPPAARLGR